MNSTIARHVMVFGLIGVAIVLSVAPASAAAPDSPAPVAASRPSPALQQEEAAVQKIVDQIRSSGLVDDQQMDLYRQLLALRAARFDAGRELFLNGLSSSENPVRTLNALNPMYTPIEKQPLALGALIGVLRSPGPRQSLVANALRALSFFDVQSDAAFKEARRLFFTPGSEPSLRSLAGQAMLGIGDPDIVATEYDKMDDSEQAIFMVSLLQYCSHSLRVPRSDKAKLDKIAEFAEKRLHSEKGEIRLSALRASSCLLDMKGVSVRNKQAIQSQVEHMALMDPDEAIRRGAVNMCRRLAESQPAQ